MNASEAIATLRKLGVPVVSTADVAAALRQSAFAASKTLARLASAGLVTSIRHGQWWLEGAIDPFRLPEHLTAPFPSYVSLQTALYLRGAIEQLPVVIYAASLARTQRIVSSAGTFSIHHVAPELYGGFEETAAGVKLASVEKALFDLAYLSGGRSRLFTSLPELELPRAFRKAELRRWLARIPSMHKRTATTRRLASFLERVVAISLTPPTATAYSTAARGPRSSRPHG